jgi:hypothetical protein
MFSFLRFLKHITVSAWKNATPIQAALITAILIATIIILVISIVQVIVPFTYIAI